MNEPEARALVLDYLAGLALAHGTVLLDEHTIERSYGWVYFYQSEDHVRTGNFSLAYVGSGGILVEAASGKLHVFGSAHPTEWYLANFELTGDPYLGSGATLELISSDPSCRNAAAMHLHRRLGMRLSEARATLMAVSDTTRQQIRAESPAAAHELAIELEGLGVHSRQLPEPVR